MSYLLAKYFKLSGRKVKVILVAPLLHHSSLKDVKVTIMGIEEWIQLKELQ